MSSPLRLREANAGIKARQASLRVLRSPRYLLVLHLLERRGALSKEEVRSVLPMKAAVLDTVLSELSRLGLVTLEESRYSLSRAAGKTIGFRRPTLDYLTGSRLASGMVDHHLNGSYLIKSYLGRGATSVTFRATQEGTHRDRAVKIFYPGTVDYLRVDDALRRRSSIRSESIPEVVDAGQIELKTPDGETFIVSCVVMTLVEDAQVFAEFLASHENVNAALLEKFVVDIGGALAAIEAAGLAHGDLHEGNILVSGGGVPGIAQKLWLIDFVGVPSSMSDAIDANSDLDNFRDHLLRASVLACERYPGYAARYLLGERVFRVLDGLRRNSYSSFNKMLQDFGRSRREIPPDYFRAPDPQPFEWLRVEWIPSARWLYELFEPELSRFQTIARFGNTWISGPRGCGKSHYLRVLAFHPRLIAEADDQISAKLRILNYDFRQAFGVLFACRLGEFKGFDPEAMGREVFDSETQAFLKHILILKIWTRTLQTIGEGVDAIDSRTNTPVIQIPPDLTPLFQFMTERLGRSAMATADPKSLFMQCLAVCTAKENSARRVWNLPVQRPEQPWLVEEDVHAFFEAVAGTFSELESARFLILVDDASYGHIHFEMQKVLNSLVRAAHARHCFKITCDKFMYTLDTNDGRSIDQRHEVTYVDLGEVSAKRQKDPEVDLSAYMSRVVNLRLRAAGFECDIQTVLGDSQSPGEFLRGLSAPGARRERGEGQRTLGRNKAYYGGWNIVWSICHGSVRTLLALIEHIFRSSAVKKETRSISLRDQDAAVRSYSQRVFRGLAMTPGELDGRPTGERLKSIIGAIGEMSREYLVHYKTGRRGQWYETISFERIDDQPLRRPAYQALTELIKNGLVMDDGLTFSRARFGLAQRYDLNKIFVPAFRITYRIRNHMYVSKGRLEEILLEPHIFVKRHRRRLRELALRKNRPRQGSLFDIGMGL